MRAVAAIVLSFAVAACARPQAPLAASLAVREDCVVTCVCIAEDSNDLADNDKTMTCCDKRGKVDEVCPHPRA